MKLLHAMTFVLLASGAAHSQTFSTLPTPVLGDNPFHLTAVNADGTVVVGSSQVRPPSGVYHSLRWLVGVGADRPAPAEGPLLDIATGVSADGGVVVGARARTGRTDYDAWVRLADTSYFLTLPDGYTTASDPMVSSDGRIVTFSVFTPGDPVHPAAPVAYDIETGAFSFLGLLPDSTSCHPGALSGDGSVIVGTCTIAHRSRAFRWTAATGMVDLGVPDGGDFSSALAVTSDGSTIFGMANNGDESYSLMRWTQEEGFVPMERYASLNGVSPDGRVLIGSFEGGQVWDDVHGVRPMTAVLQGAGLAGSLVGWVIHEPSAVNQGLNGYVFAGLASNLSGLTWWVATLPSMDGACPSILRQPPEFATAAPGGTVVLAAGVGGAEPLALGWFRNGDPLSDDDHFSGTTSSTLVITDARKSDSGRYHLRATNECGTVESTTTRLDVTTPPPPCVPDFNGDWVVNTQDFFDFLSAFFEYSPRADINRDTLVNSQDFFDYVAVYFIGC